MGVEGPPLEQDDGAAAAQRGHGAYPHRGAVHQGATGHDRFDTVFVHRRDESGDVISRGGHRRYPSERCQCGDESLGDVTLGVHHSFGHPRGPTRVQHVEVVGRPQLTCLGLVGAQELFESDGAIEVRSPVVDLDEEPNVGQAVPHAVYAVD